MKKCFYIFLIIISTISLACCNSQNYSEVNDLSFGQKVNIIIDIEGAKTVEIKRLSRGWNDFHQVAWGTYVEKGDLIQPPENGSVTILCADLSLINITRESGILCPSNDSKLYWQDFQIIRPMSSNDQFPRLIYPRGTLILEKYPLIKWSNNGADSYKVRLLLDGKIIWEQSDILNTQIVYPNNAPELSAGERYIIEVVDTSTGYSSFLDPLKDQGFSLVSDSKRNSIIIVKEEILSLSLNTFSKDFVIGIYLLNQELYGEAIEYFNRAELNQQLPVISFWKGKSYEAMSLHEEALDEFNKCVSMASELNDLEFAAKVYIELWNITGQQDYFDTAIKYYYQLGDLQTVDYLIDD